MILAALFVSIAAVITLAAIVAIYATAHVYYLTGSRGISDDGLFRAAPAPVWSLLDSAGNTACSPPATKPLQLIIFSDHSLGSFPSVMDGLRDLLASAPSLEVVMLTRGPNELAGTLLQVTGLGDIRVVAGSSDLYGKYNVRVLPFAIFVDGDARVRASSLVNHAWQVEQLWRLANVAPGPDEMPAASRWLRRLAEAR